jgi:putative oxidoreductase
MTIFRLCDQYAPLIGRVFIGALFLSGGIGKIMGGVGAGVAMLSGYIASVGLPFATLLAVLTIVLEIVGGAAIILGFKARYSALLLAGFMVLVTYFFHWDFSSQMAVGTFLNHLVIIGALLYVATFGAGRYSLDSKRS